MDNGYPLSTEANVLKELVHPPSGIKNAMKAIGVANKSKCVELSPIVSPCNVAVSCDIDLIATAPEAKVRYTHSISRGHVTLCSMSQSLPTGQLSNFPWRKSEVWYAANDIYVDLIEEVCAVLR